MSKLILPNPGDTLISEIIYNEDITVIVNGKPYSRRFKEHYCKDSDCNNQILAKYITSKKYGYAIVGNKRHNDTWFCCDVCRNKFKSESLSKSKKSAGYIMNKKGYPVRPISKERAFKQAGYIVRLGQASC